MKSEPVLIAVAAVVVSAVIYNQVQKRRSKPPVYYVKSLANNYNARTIPPFGIFIKESEKSNEALLNHELVHWKQYQRMGLIGYYRTYLSQIKQYGYDAMPMEKEARANESTHCQYNYTDCVRTGKSNTVFNQSFRA